MVFVGWGELEEGRGTHPEGGGLQDWGRCLKRYFFEPIEAAPSIVVLRVGRTVPPDHSPVTLTVYFSRPRIFDIHRIREQTDPFKLDQEAFIRQPS